MPTGDVCPIAPPKSHRGLMPTFTYTARAINGDLKSATIEAPSRDDVIKQLRQLKLNVVKIDEGTANRKKRGGSIKMRDIVIFTRQFSTMINAGLPLVQALSILSDQSENPALKDITKQVVYDVESGNTLADAMRKHPKAFNELYVNMERTSGPCRDARRRRRRTGDRCPESPG